jgi:hypothetical protein
LNKNKRLYGKEKMDKISDNKRWNDKKKVRKNEKGGD